MMKTPFVLLALATMALTGLSGCAALKESGLVKEPDIRYESFSIKDISADGISLAPRLAISNPNSFPIPIDKVHYGISLNNNELTSGSTDSVGKIPANGTKSSDFLVNLSGESISAIKEILFNDGKVNIDLSGKTDIMGFSLPFEKRLTIARPKISFGGFEMKKTGFEEVVMELALNVDNPNDFPLPITDLGYKVSSEGKSLFSGKTEKSTLNKGQNTLKMPITLKPGELFSNMFSMMMKGKLPLKIETDNAFFNYAAEKDIDISTLLGR